MSHKTCNKDIEHADGKLSLHFAMIHTIRSTPPPRGGGGGYVTFNQVEGPQRADIIPRAL